ncbi:MAG: Gldg family protein [Spirochaetaceae bacterium]|nr:Gldg family protein [Spirochaetaceae bacterium]
MPNFFNLFKSIFNLRSRRAVSGVVTLVVFTAILLVVNLLASNLNLQIDSTRVGLYTLEPETAAILNNLDVDVNIYFLMDERIVTSNVEVAQINEVLALYANASNRVSYRMINAERNPALVAPFVRDGETIHNGSIIVAGPLFHRIIDPREFFGISMRGDEQVISSINVESLVTNALQFAMNGREGIIYLLMGHSGLGLHELALSDGRSLLAALENLNYTVRPLSLLTDGEVPADASMLMLFDPRRDISEQEEAVLSAYLAGGGRLYVQLNPPAFVSSGGFERLTRLVEEYGLALTANLISETDSTRLLPQFTGNPHIFIVGLENHIITQSISRRPGALVIAAWPLAIEEAPLRRRNVMLAPILTTSNNGLTLQLDNGNPLPLSTGRHSFAMASYEQNMTTGRAEGARLFVLAQEAGFTELADNGNLILNAVAWLDDNEVVRIDTKSLLELPLQLNHITALLLAALIVLVLPALVFVVGFVVSYKRKHL